MGPEIVVEQNDLDNFGCDRRKSIRLLTRILSEADRGKSLSNIGCYISIVRVVNRVTH